MGEIAAGTGLCSNPPQCFGMAPECQLAPNQY